MKFLYEYRTRDNVRHQGEIRAATREAAFAALKAQGVRPGCVTEAPGFFNKLFGKGKRWIAISVLASLCLTLGLLIATYRRENTTLHSTLSTLHSSLDAATRRQVIGDTAVIEEGLNNGWASVFELEGDRFLASYAVPGVPAAVRSTTEEKLLEALESSPSAVTAESDSLEARQIRAIVAGMKEELRAFIADGGTIVEYGQRLVERQTQEVGYYERFSKEIERAKESGMDADALTELWQTYNAKLRRLGIKLIAFPD